LMDLLYITWFFFLTVFINLSLFSVLVALTIICQEKVLVWPCLFGVLEATYTWMGVSFSWFGKFSAIILLSILHIHLACTSYPSCMPMIQVLYFDGLFHLSLFYNLLHFISLFYNLLHFISEFVEIFFEFI
jgi:hypothetical protein